jgi:hypothetical protein
MNAVATFIFSGWQQTESGGAIELWTTLRAFGRWSGPEFTLSRETIEANGYCLPHPQSVGQVA